MAETNLPHYTTEPFTYYSNYLDREIKLETFLPKAIEDTTEGITLLLINDGQDMERLGFAQILEAMAAAGEIEPILAVGIHCNEDRRLEYGTADVLDCKQRGSRARYHRRFVLEELIPFIHEKYHPEPFKEIAYAGFSLGGLSAMDIAWKHPEVFTKVGAFSGSFWWRLRDLDEGYVEETDRIMHLLVREGEYAPKLKFFFQAGALDETADRNGNGIIDSIDDTLGLIAELAEKGYRQPQDITYLELADGHHDIPTWAQAMPHFLKWGWGREMNNE